MVRFSMTQSGLTLQNMAKRQILPAVSAFGGALARTLQAKKACGTDVRYESETLDKVSALTGELYHRVEGMNGILARAAGIGDSLKLACFCRDSILPAMEAMNPSGFFSAASAPRTVSISDSASRSVTVRAKARTTIQ